MNNIDALKKKICELEIVADELLQSGKTILGEATIKSSKSSSLARRLFLFLFPEGLAYDHPVKEIQRKAIRRYEEWYSASLYLVTEYSPKSVRKFEFCYSTVSEFFRYHHGSSWQSKDRLINRFTSNFNEQITILVRIPAALEIKEMTLKKLISAEFIRTELEEAEMLLKAKHYRAAGAIAGVALELYLKTLCDVHEINLPPKPTLDPLATTLYKAGKLDGTELKHIQYLASLRNKCSHANDVSEVEVSKLIEAVKELSNSMR